VVVLVVVLVLGVGWLGSEYVSVACIPCTFARTMTPSDHPADHDDPLKRAMMSLTRRLVALKALRTVIRCHPQCVSGNDSRERR